MASDLEAARQQALRRWRLRFPDTTAVADAVPRQRATVVGVVHKVRLVPGKSLEATVEDGTGRLTAEWMGRSRLPGVELGSALRLSGTVAADDSGRLRMRNPDYQPIAEPYS